MGIRFYCPSGHKLNVKEFQAGRKGICPYCGAKVQIPTESTRQPSKKSTSGGQAAAAGTTPDYRPEDGLPVAIPVGFPGGVAPGQPPDPQVPVAGPPTGQPVAFAPAQPGQQSPATAGGLMPAVSNPIQSSPVADPGHAATATGTVPATTPVAPAGASAAPPSSSSVADPLTEAGDVVWYVRPASGGQFGPAGAEVMRTWIEEGRVGGDSLVWREGWRDWQEASATFPQLGAGRANSPLAGLSTGNTPATSAPRTGWTRSRRQSQSHQAMIIILLIAAVVILSGVFLWVLFRQPPSQPDPPGAAAPVTMIQQSARRSLPFAVRPLTT